MQIIPNVFIIHSSYKDTKNSNIISDARFISSVLLLKAYNTKE